MGHDLETFAEEADHRFQADFWWKPDRGFPYLVNLAKAVASESFYLRILASLGRQPLAYEYTTDNELRRNLSAIIIRFHDSAISARIRPLVIFIPQNQSTYRVSAKYADELDAWLGGGVVFEFTDAGMDWSRYNLKPDGNCHPSRYGAERIAGFIGGLIPK